jgi:hypothetical protein
MEPKILDSQHEGSYLEAPDDATNRQRLENVTVESSGGSAKVKSHQRSWTTNEIEDTYHTDFEKQLCKDVSEMNPPKRLQVILIGCPIPLLPKFQQERLA